MKTYDQIMNAMKAYIVAHQTIITDLNEGSVIASILEAVAREISAEYIAIVSNIDTYQKKIAFAQFDFRKKAGVAATGSIVFSRDSAHRNDLYIPVRTEVATSDGIKFTTVEDVLITAGTTESSSAEVVCETLGTAGNVAAGAISIINSTITGLSSVTNAVACSGGVDEETDDEYDSRFREFIQGLGQSSVPGIKAAVLAINGVKSCSIVEHFPPVSGINITVYAEDGSGTLPDDLLTEVDNVVNGGGDKTGIRAAGIRAQISAPVMDKITVTVEAAIDWSVPRQYIEDEMNTKIAGYIASLGIGAEPDLKVLENFVKGQYGISSVSNVTISGLPEVFDDSMIVRLDSVVAEFS